MLFSIMTLSITTNRIIRFPITRLSIATLGITTESIIRLSITTFSIIIQTQ